MSSVHILTNILSTELFPVLWLCAVITSHMRKTYTVIDRAVISYTMQRSYLLKYLVSTQEFIIIHLFYVGWTGVVNNRIQTLYTSVGVTVHANIMVTLSVF